MASIQIRGIIKHQSLLTASAAMKANGQRYDQKSYSVDIMIHKSEPSLPAIIEGFRLGALSKFPAMGGQLPPGAHECFKDCAIQYPGNLAVQDYYQLTLRQREDNGRPEVTHMDSSPIIDPSDIKIGDFIWVKGESWAYDTGDGGNGCFLNGSLITMEQGWIPLEELSSKPSQAQNFAGVAGFSTAGAAGAAGAAAVAPAVSPAAPAPAAAIQF